MRKYLDLLNESVETKTQEKKEPNPLLEGKYGPHSSNLDDAIDSALAALGDDPTIEEIYAQTDPIRKNSDLGGWFSTSDYREKQALGVIAEKLGLPGLYRSKGKGFVSSEKEKDEDGRETGRYLSSTGASDRDVEVLAKKGYLTQKQASTLGVAELFGKRLWGKDDSEEYKGTRDANTSAKEQRSMKRKFKRFLELVAKAKNDTKEADESITFESKLVSQIYRSLLREGLTDEEQKELDALADELAKFKFSDEAFGEKVLQAVQDYEDWSDEQMDTKLDKAAQDQADMEKQYDKDYPAESGSLEAFLKSGKKSIENNPEEKKALKELQELYNKLGFDSGKPDGVWGPKTKAATEEFQKFMGLTVDGQPGPQTIGAALKIKDFGNIKEFKTDLDKMVELIGKGGKIYIPKNGDSGGEMDVTDLFPNGIVGDWDQDGAITAFDRESALKKGNPRYKVNKINVEPKTDSIDFRHLMSIVEGKMLFEALSADEQKLLMDLYNKHKDKFDTAPEMFKDSIDTIKGAITDQEPSTTDDKADDKADDKDKEEKTDAQKFEDVKAASEIADAIHEAGDGWLFGFGTDEEAMVALLGKIKSAEQYTQVNDIFKEKYGESVREYVEGEFSFGDESDVIQMINKWTSGSNTSTEAVIVMLADQVHDAVDGIGTDEEQLLTALAKLKNNDWKAFSDYYKQRYGADVLQDIKGDVSGEELEQVNGILAKFGVKVGPFTQGSKVDAALGKKITYKVGDPITAEIQTKLKKLGKDAGMIGEPLTADDVKALNGEGTDPLPNGTPKTKSTVGMDDGTGAFGDAGIK